LRRSFLKSLTHSSNPYWISSMHHCSREEKTTFNRRMDECSLMQLQQKEILFAMYKFKLASRKEAHSPTWKCLEFLPLVQSQELTVRKTLRSLLRKRDWQAEQGLRRVARAR
jgi:hypothetical protein